MKLYGFVILLMAGNQASLSVKDARDQYFRSSDAGPEAAKFEQMLEPVKENDNPVLVAYKGAAEMLKAKTVSSPIGKMTCFNKGKKLIEAAILRDSLNMESRFIRYSIQVNLPGFLDYKKNIASDRTLVERSMDTLSDIEFKNKITAFLKDPKARISKAH